MNTWSRVATVGMAGLAGYYCLLYTSDAVVPVKGGGPLQLHKKVGEEDVAGAFDHEHQACLLYTSRCV